MQEPEVLRCKCATCQWLKRFMMAMTLERVGAIEGVLRSAATAKLSGSTSAEAEASAEMAALGEGLDLPEPPQEVIESCPCETCAGLRHALAHGLTVNLGEVGEMRRNFSVVEQVKPDWKSLIAAALGPTS